MAGSNGHHILHKQHASVHSAVEKVRGCHFRRSKCWLEVVRTSDGKNQGFYSAKPFKTVLNGLKLFFWVFFWFLPL